MRFRTLIAVAFFTLGPTPAALAAQAPSRPELHVVRNVRLSDAKDAPKSMLVLRDGRIESLQAEGGEVPAGARVVDANGALAVPAFLDAYSFAGFQMPKPNPARDLPPPTNADVLVDMRDANRKGILATFRAADALELDLEADKRYRESGFGAWLAAPHGELLSGTSALMTSRHAAVRDRVRKPFVFAHGGFDCTGPGYPGTLMGSIAQLRQFLLDARWVRELDARASAGKPGRRPPYDAELAAATALLDRKSMLVCEAETASDIERWVKLADEFGLSIAISGGREAWRRAELLAARKIPVVLTLQWGEEVEDPHAKKDKPAKEGKKPGDDAKEPKSADTVKAGAIAASTPGSDPAASSLSAGTPEVKPAVSSAPAKAPETKLAEGAAPAGASEAKPVAVVAPAGTQDSKPASETAPAGAKPAPSKTGDEADETKRWIYDEPLRVKEEKRRLWVEKRDCALRLHEASVVFVFGSGKDSPKDLLGRVRTLVENGLPRDVAQRALTTSVSELCGVGASLGRIERGADASFGLWSEHPLSNKEARLAWLFVEGVSYEFELDSNELKGKPDEGVDLSGRWTLTFDDANVKPAAATLEMARDGATKGVLRFKSPFDDSDLQGDVQGRVAGRKVRLTGRVKVGTFESEVTIEGELEGASLEGNTTWKWSGGETTSTFKAARAPEKLHEEGDGLEDFDDHAHHEPRKGGGL
ncbi:MAG: hypothetical protein IPJ77_22475 [Planctomycetes bacterium]|nr:hypothetical protein [Planctomycetota bacterium]